MVKVSQNIGVAKLPLRVKGKISFPSVVKFPKCNLLAAPQFKITASPRPKF